MKNEQPTLIFLTPGFPKDESDSTCLPFLQLMINSLNRQYPGLKVIILAFDYPFSKDRYQWNSNTVIPFNGWKKNRVKKLFMLISIWRTLKRIRKGNNLLGIVSFWCGICALTGHRFANKYRLQHYCWVPGQDAREGNHYVKKIRPRPEELMAISDFIQNEFERNHGIRPAHVIPNGIDPAVFPQEKFEKNIDVMAAGSLITLKQYEIFVGIIRELKHHFPVISAELCGKGPEENKLRQLIDEYDLQDNLKLDGELSHPQVLIQMKRSRLFLHTSNYEGFSTVCIEALYAGAVVISFCKPMNEPIPNWYIVDTKEAMLQKAVEILSSPAQQDPVLPYSMDDSVKKMMGLFRYTE
jgi:glycosyltransferase involved in cell wall biosynthesis